MNGSRLPRRIEALPHSAAPLLGSANSIRTRLRAVLSFKPELKSFCRCRALRSLSIWEVVLPAPRRRHAAGRERHDLPSYVVFIAHLQSSSQGQRGCWRSPHGHCGRRIEGYGLDRDRSLTSRRAEASQWPRLRQSTGSWFVVEYGSQALHHSIGMGYRAKAVGPTSGAKGAVPLHVPLSV